MIEEQYNTKLELRDRVQLENTFLNAENIVAKKYLTTLESSKITPMEKSLENIDMVRNSRFFKLEKLVYDKDENNLDKLSSVLNAVSFAKGNIALILNSDGDNIEYYLGIINKNSNTNLTSQYETLEGAFKGNFKGSKFDMLKNSKVRQIVDDIFDESEGQKIVSSISGVASLIKEKNNDTKSFIQGLEKLTDSMQGKKYSILLLADCVPNELIDNIKIGYENLYSNIYPFLKTNVTMNESDTASLTDGITKGFTDTINNSITYTQSDAKTHGTSETNTMGQTSNSDAVASSIGGAIGSVVGSVVPIVGTVMGAAIGSGAANLVVGKNSKSESIGKNNSNTSTIGESNQQGTSKSISNQENISNTQSNTIGKSVQINCENKKIKLMLDKIDKQLERINECESFGCFSVATYVISNDTSVNNSVASLYNSLVKGENSSVEKSVINTWKDEIQAKKIKNYLSKFMHPIFDFNLEEQQMTSVTPASFVNSKELSVHLMLPKKAVQGISVISSAAFGRNVFKLSNSKENFEDLTLGNIYHMGDIESKEVKLSKKSLAMHTFVTGSTGSGKSNTIYQMLDEFNKNDVKFLVVEPAKGEYKNVFGHREDVTVLGTNSKYTKLLRINPFKFAKDIHVLEHIDKLVEIFNACWPMYAAMPAVLKDSIEQAYKISGWNLLTSENKYNDELYPTFKDVLEQLNKTINSSAFSEELKGNYIGALSTRIKSLTNGLNGQIFCGEEVDNKILFDSNVIVDISRVGAMETKSMIMGILIMRLQEHRITQGGMNKELHHVTVLEEAHNILKKTSTEQSGEGSNLLGKSVEMLSNSIAEMRTYGEGFVIVDQSPNMLDMSAIRNTNTKIILRLPEQADRELVGKSIGLNENQIAELAKLQTGVASVYQNDWIESILCKVNYYESSEKIFVEKDEIENIKDMDIEVVELALHKYKSEEITENIDILKEQIIKSDYSTDIKIKILTLLDKNDEIKIDDISSIIKYFYYTDDMLEVISNSESYDQLNEILLRSIEQSENSFKQIERNIILNALLREIAIEKNELNKFYFGWVEYMGGSVK